MTAQFHRDGESQRDTSETMHVRIRSRSRDPFGGARGHDYIRLRGLSPKVRPGGLAIGADCQCDCCALQRMLPAVQAICNRRQDAGPPGSIPWNDVHNDQVQDLLDVPTVIGM